MSSPFRSPLASSNSTRIGTPHANNGPFDSYRASEDSEPKADLRELKLSVKESVGDEGNGQGFLTGPTPLETLPAWRRGLAATSPFTASEDKESDDVLPLLANSSRTLSYSRRRCRGPKLARCVLFPLLGFFIMLGIIQFIIIACGIAMTFFSDDLDRLSILRWQHEERLVANVSHWPTDFTRDIIPVGCHSHNDYWRPVPLFSAIQAGCIGVEADVWLFDDELYVGHTTSSLTRQRTLRNLYIDPLIRILGKQNPTSKLHPTADQSLQGVFDTDPSQSLILLIDFKTDGDATWNTVVEQLSPLRGRGYLTHFNGTDVVNGPITVVGTGNTPFNLVAANSTYRDIFFDAPLEKLAEDYDMDNAESQGFEDHIPEDEGVMTDRSNENVGQGLSGFSGDEIGPGTFNWTNSYYASVSFRKSIGFPWLFHLSDRQTDKIKAQIRGAHQRGLKVRYWELPSWPRSLRNHIWTVLVREGVDILNVDDLQSATKQDWRPKFSDWWH
ncbi:PLC-like phosphodiesterase [Aspergillus pseudotamarii]|uniref:Altered inheritance of mitochondria protein 6 n=1 Tax=Aspergillus pseudotamarii TaxID=132259 RepID=A0A5N6T2W0_ASPPS|nr:PLC-like phosphodiesterase [Aspergillus pseudotamarii]KAE8140609.1 PLC-like phosphodiesterase [Aspergillus pseudotamarii]